MNYEEHFDASAEKRNAFWETIGTLDPYVISHIINPAFMGGPAWPSLRQAFVNVQTKDSTIIASDGLSDPYDDFDTNPDNQSYNGLGLEFYVQTPGKLDLETMQKSWQFNLVYQMSQLAAQNGNLITMVNKHQYISTELYDVPVPKSFLNKDGRVGVLLGIQSENVPYDLDLSIEKILVVNITLLTLEELNYIVERGAEARKEIAEKIIAQGKPGYSSLDRKSVV